MMRGRLDIRQLEKIVRIRALQSMAAAAAAGRAAEASRQSVETVETETDRMIAIEQDWHGSLQSQGLSSGMTRLWAAELLRQQVTVASAQDAADEAGVEAERQKEEWAGSVLRQDAATDMRREAGRALLHRREEAALSEATDRVSLRGSEA